MRGKGDQLGWRGAWRWPVAILSLLIAFTVAFYFWTGVPQAERRAWPAYQRVVAGGTPLDLTAFLASFAAQPEENAAEELIPALKRLSKTVHDLSHEERKLVRDGAASFNDPLARSALAKVEPELRAVQAASRRPRFVPARDWSVPAATLFAEYAQLREVMQISALKARIHAKRGDVDGAIEMLQLGSRLGQYASDEPLLIGHLVSMALRAINAKAAQHCAALDPKHASRYLQVLESNTLPPLGRTIRGEVFFAVAMSRSLDHRAMLEHVTGNALTWLANQGINIGDSPYSNPMEEQSFPVSQEGLPSDLFARASIARILENMEPVLALLDEEGREITPGTLAPAMAKLAIDVERDQSVSNWAAQMVLPIYSQVFIAEKRVEAELHLGRSWAKVLEFRERNGRWPKDLDEAGAEQPDPFSPGSMLNYRLVGKGFRIWSLGDDGVDQNGRSQSEAKSSAFDQVLIYPVP